MQENRERWRHSKCRDNVGSLLHRLRCQWTGDDSATVFGICVSLLTFLAGALAYIVLFRLAGALASTHPILFLREVHSTPMCSTRLTIFTRQGETA